MKMFLRSPLLTLLLFIAATVLLVAGGVGTTQAAISSESAVYRTEMKMKNIGVTLLESTKADMSAPVEISFRSYGTGTTGRWAKEQTGDLIQNMVQDAGDTTLKIGKTYPFYLSVQNSGEVDEYVRVTIYKYWVDASGQKIKSDGWFNGGGSKTPKYDPKLIKIESYDGLWEMDTEASTDERLVFYYKDPLEKVTGTNPGEKTATPVTKSLTIDSSIKDYAVKDEKGVYHYAYDNFGFVIEVQVDAVQASHSDQSIPSAWGVQR